MVKKVKEDRGLDFVEELDRVIPVSFSIKCSKEQFAEFDKVCKDFWGDSRHVMLSSLLSFYQSFAGRMDALEERLDVVTLLTKRVLELENKVGDKKVVRMNDGTEVERNE